MPNPMETMDTAIERFDNKMKEAHRYNDAWLVSTLPHMRTLLIKARRSLEEGNINSENMVAIAIAEQIISSTED
jgi:hypothetical protein